ncbi:MAG: FAD-dependent oxidoreductase, partial [Actinobacteria bacterium]|nr:FAD-dependent oxidoreductase [Actinomycetota bacterium]
MTTVAVIGGGASGTLVATNLLRCATGPLEVVVIEPRQSLGRGVAYSTTDPHHLLNVRAKQMSAVVGDPDHFVRFCGCGRDDFAPRRLYATYLETLLDEARTSSKASLRHLVTRATRVVRSDGAWVITCADGSTTRADVVVLATGNPAPTIPPWAEGLVGSPRFIADPWAPGALEGIGEETVVAIGTGLTFV